MGLGVCHACNRECLSDARYCPWCGKSDPVEGDWSQAVGCFVGVIFLLFLIIFSGFDWVFISLFFLFTLVSAYFKYRR